MVNKILLMIFIHVSLFSFIGCKRDGIFDISVSTITMVDNNYIVSAFYNNKNNEKIYAIQCTKSINPISYNYKEDHFILIINGEEINMHNNQLLFINKSGMAIFYDNERNIINNLKITESIDQFLLKILTCHRDSLYNNK